MNNNTLEFLVTFRKDDQSYAEVKQQIDELQQAAKEAMGGDAREGVDDYRESVQELNDVNERTIDDLVELQQRMDDYRKTINAFRKVKKDTVDVGNDLLRSEQEAKMALQATNKEYKDSTALLVANSGAVSQGSATYAQLVARNRQLASAMRNVPMDDTTGKLGDMREAYATNLNALKEFDATMGDHRRNVGNYSESLSVLAGGIASVQGPLGPIAGRLTAVNSVIARSIPILKAKTAAWGGLRLAMIATGFGAIIVLVGSIIAALSRAEKVVDAVTKRFQQIAAVTTNLIARLGAFLGVSEEVNESMGEAWQRAGDLFDANVALEKQEIKNTVASAKRRVEISKLRQEAEDENNTIEDRIDKLQRAMDITEEEIAQEIKLAETRRDNLKEQMEGSEDGREEMQELADAEAALIELQGKQADQIRTLQRRQTSLTATLRTQEQARVRLIRRINQQIEAQERESQASMDALRRQTREAQDEFLFDQQMASLRRNNKVREMAVMESRRTENNIVEKALEERAKMEQRHLDAVDTLVKLYEDQGMNKMEARIRAENELREGQVAHINALERRRSEAITQERERLAAELSRIEAEADKDRMDSMDTLAELEQQAMLRQMAEDVSFVQRRDERLIMLEIQQAERRRELELAMREQGFSQEMAALRAARQAELEFEQQVSDTRKAIMNEEAQERGRVEQQILQTAQNAASSFFESQKLAAVANAIISTYEAVQKARTLGPPKGPILAAVELAAGLNNVRRIVSTNIGDTTVGGGGGRESVGRSFQMVDVEPTAAMQTASQASEPSTDQMQPVFVFQGDMNPEVMAIKVHQGNRMINMSTPSTSARK